LVSEADRRLTVRIRGAFNGKKVVDVMLVDAAGSTVAEDHKQYGVNDACYFVLYKTARASANLLGAFEPPPPPEPHVCPTPMPCPACPACPASRPIPTLPPPRVVTPAAIHRVMVGAGMGIFRGTVGDPMQGVGPYGSLTVVPSVRVPDLRIEVEGAWVPYTSGKSNAPRGEMIPLFLSVCHVPSALRLCGGLVTTFFRASRTDGARANDETGVATAASMRIGADLAIAGPFSMRVDTFVLMGFWGRTFGHEPTAIDARNLFAAGMVAMGVWSFE
jgi:hypothetical protein